MKVHLYVALYNFLDNYEYIIQTSIHEMLLTRESYLGNIDSTTHGHAKLAAITS
jgi:hypothetical protein